MSTQITSGTWGSSPSAYGILYAEQLWGSGTQRGVRVYAQLKVNGSTSSSRYGYPLNIEFWCNGSRSGNQWCKGTEYWYGTDNVREFYYDFTIDVGTNSSTSVGVAFYVNRSDGGSSSWNGGGLSGYYTVGATNQAPTLSGTISTSPSGIIPENTKTLTVTCPEASDADGNLTGYRIQMAVNKSGNFSDVLNSSDKTRTVNVDISSYGEGTVFEFRADAHDSYGANSSGWVTSYYITKNKLTGYTLKGGSSISYGTTSLSFTYSGASNTNGNTTFTKKLSCSGITVYNSTSLGTSSFTLTIYKSGTAPSTPYIKFDDLKNKLKSSNYVGNIVFTLSTTNSYGTTKTSSVTLNANIKTQPNSATGVTISTTASESTSYRTLSNGNKYFIPDGSSKIRVKWTAGSGKLGEEIGYSIYISYNGGSYQKVTDTTNTYYDQVFPKLTQTKTIKYMVRTYCKVDSSYNIDSAASSQVTLHYYNNPTISQGAITRAETTADVVVNINANTSIPSVGIAGNWSVYNSADSTKVVTGTNLATSQGSQTIKVTGITGNTSYILHVFYNDNTGLYSGDTKKITIGVNAPIFYVNKYGVGVGGSKADATYAVNVKGALYTSDKAAISGTATITGNLAAKSNLNVTGVTTATGEIKANGGLTATGNISATGNIGAKTMSTSSNTSIGGNLTVTGYTFANSLKIGTSSSNKSMNKSWFDSIQTMWDKGNIYDYKLEPIDGSDKGIYTPTWTKYQDGRMIAYGDVSLSSAATATNVWISGWNYYRWNNPVAYGVTFAEYPRVYITFESNDSITAMLNGCSKTGISRVDIYTPWTNGAVPGTLHYLAIGRWK